MKKKLENIVQDIYKAITPLSKGDGLDLSEEDKNTINGNSLINYDYLKNYKFKEYIKNNDTFYVEIQPLTIAQGKIEKIVG